jgi:uncharacterized alpha/beta hydrolase family protein
MFIRFKKLAIGIVISLTVVSILILPVSTDAQDSQQKQPDQKEMMQMMGPMMSTMMENMMDTMFKVLAKLENAERLATFTRNYYDALIKKGFSKEEALQITKAVGMPALSGMQ